MKSIFKCLSLTSLFMLCAFFLNASPVHGGSDDKPVSSTQALHTQIKQTVSLHPGISQAKSIAVKHLIKAGIKNTALHGHHNTYAFSDDNTDKIIAVLLVLIFPPLGVAVWEDGITGHFWLSLILTLIFWLPGLIYSLLIVLN